MKEYLKDAERLGLRDKLFRTRFKPDTENHLRVNQEVCKECSERVCLNVCPAEVYTEGDNGLILVGFEGCLECGTCRIACTREAIDWINPKGGFGVCYRFG